MNDREKALTIIVMVPLIIFSGIFGYLYYQEYTEQKMALGFWEYYSFIRSNAVVAPENCTSWNLLRLGIDECPDYPIEYKMIFGGNYVGHTFLMPWGAEETYWEQTQ